MSSLLEPLPVAAEEGGTPTRERPHGVEPEPCPADLISVVIPCFNEASVLGRTLAHLAPHQAASRFEVVVADDGSSDETVAIAARHGVPVVLSSGGDRGSAGARNRGANLARGQLLLFLDADVLIDRPEYFFAEVRRRFADPGLAAASVHCSVYPDQATLAERVYHQLYDVVDWACNRLGLGTAGGWCQIVRRAPFDAVGGFDPTFTSGQDVDLFFRLSRSYRTRHLHSLVVHESPRRYRGKGLLRTAIGWFVNGVSVCFFRRPYLRNYPPVR